MLHFPLYDGTSFPWASSSVMQPIAGLLGSLSVTKFVIRTNQMKFAAFVCSLLWMIGLLACALWVGRSFSKESFKYLWPITVRCSRFFVLTSRHPTVVHILSFTCWWHTVCVAGAASGG